MQMVTILLSTVPRPRTLSLLLCVCVCESVQKNSLVDAHKSQPYIFKLAVSWFKHQILTNDELSFNIFTKQTIKYASELSSIILILQTFQSHPLHLQHSLEAQL